jgi:hypothetical protein
MGRCFHVIGSNKTRRGSEEYFPVYTLSRERNVAIRAEKIEALKRIHHGIEPLPR